MLRTDFGLSPLADSVPRNVVTVVVSSCCSRTLPSPSTRCAHERRVRRLCRRPDRRCHRREPRARQVLAERQPALLDEEPGLGIAAEIVQRVLCLLLRLETAALHLAAACRWPTADQERRTTC